MQFSMRGLLQDLLTYISLIYFQICGFYNTTSEMGACVWNGPSNQTGSNPAEAGWLNGYVVAATSFGMLECFAAAALD